jgi:hypothetical protein
LKNANQGQLLGLLRKMRKLLQAVKVGALTAL